jgi:NAD(P)-dependent dehydrogenase (short-subunit alcohol dehydrogenase family)
MNKVAIVTGGARGIGHAIARKFLAQDYRVAIFDLNSVALGDAYSLQCDVSDPAQVTNAVARVIERYGRIDALVNNAGIAVFKPLLETSYEPGRL